MNIIFLDHKIRKSPAYKTIKEKLKQKSQHLENKIYQYLKEAKNQGKIDQNFEQEFDRHIEEKIATKPTQVISSCLLRSQQKKYSKNITLKQWRNKKTYQGQTFSSIGKKSKRSKSTVDEYFSKTLSDCQSLSSHDHIAFKFQKSWGLKKFYSKNRHLNNQNDKSEERHTFYETNDEIDYYNTIFSQLNKISKNFEIQLQTNKKQYSTLSEMNAKADTHFSELILQPKEMGTIENILQGRFKFSSNRILDNVLIKKDSEVQQWIEMEKNKLMRKNGTKKITYDQISWKDINKSRLIQKTEGLINNTEQDGQELLRSKTIPNPQSFKTQFLSLKTQQQSPPKLAIKKYRKVSLLTQPNYYQMKQLQQRKYQQETSKSKSLQNKIKISDILLENTCETEGQL